MRMKFLSVITYFNTKCVSYVYNHIFVIAVKYSVGCDN